MTLGGKKAAQQNTQRETVRTSKGQRETGCKEKKKGPAEKKRTFERLRIPTWKKGEIPGKGKTQIGEKRRRSL